MTSKIKVDNIENQCGGAVVTKCGATTTISGSVVKADDIQAADGGNLINQCGTTITLGASGDTINLASGASQSGFGRTGTVDWQTTPKTTGTFTAVSGEGYFLNTSGGVITANLPAGVAGAIVSFADYAATWQTSNVTVTPNGTEKIGSLNENATLNVEGQSVTFVYVDSTQGWINTMDSTSNVRGAAPLLIATGGTISTDGDFKVHTFTGPGTFTVCSVADCASYNTVAYTVIAGGASGGKANNNNNAAGGAGAGGFREGRTSPIVPYTASPLVNSTGITVSATSYPITVGGGGSGQATNSRGNSGSNSVFSSITSTGGGGGGSNYTCSGTGGSGGSGGGSANNCGTGAGAGNTPPVSPPQGQNGGAGGGTAPEYKGAGGGGSGGTGFPGNGSPPGNGGVGVSTSINGSPTSYAGGGGAGAYGCAAGKAGSSCGTGGAGAGTGNGVSGTTNTGGGGGGTNAPGGTSGAGGSGIVIIRYKFQ